jgi:hypothetical protein
MPWTCPACLRLIQHSAEMPHPDRVYRCPVCRLQMVFDPDQKKMKPDAPDDEDGGKRRKVA